MSSSQSLRFKKFIDYFFETQKSAAAALNVTDGYISHIVSGKRQLNGEILNKIAYYLPTVNIDWLVHGRGSMLWSETVDGEYVEVKEDEIIFLPAGSVKSLPAGESPPAPVGEGDVWAVIRDLEERVRALEGWRKG